MSAAESQPATPKPSHRWFRVTPDRLVLLLLLIEGLLWLSERFRWLPFDEHKGWTVLIAVAAVAAFLLVMLVWFAGALVLRWPFQFSIRSLLVLTVAVAVPCSWLATEMRSAERQQEAINVINDRGYVIYRENPSNVEPPPGPPWLRSILGDCFFSDVVAANVCDDAGMVHLDRLTGLESLYVDLTNGDGELDGVADAGMEHLEKLDQLQYLEIDSKRITDAGLMHLGKLQQLKELSIVCPQINEAGLRHISNLTGLRSLIIYDARITGEGLEHIGKLTRLEELRLDNIQLTDGGLRHLQDLVQLEALVLRGTILTPADLLPLAELPRLTSLQLGITDKEPAVEQWAHCAAPYLAHITTLRNLSIGGLNDEDLKKLQAALPKCAIGDVCHGWGSGLAPVGQDTEKDRH